MRWLACAALLLVAIAVTSCRIIATADIPALANESAGHGAAPFDPDKSVTSIWAPKVVPYFEKKAGPFVQVRELAAKSPDEAGARFGYRAKSEGTPWTLIVRIDGVIVGANTESRAATIDVDVSGQAKTDAAIQIGPAIRGTAIRDALDFVSFNDFTNQIDFAQFGKAFNTHVYRETLEKLPRESLIGRKVSVLGAYPFVSTADMPLVTPVEIAVGPKP
jgi:predicted lipoprotein